MKFLIYFVLLLIISSGITWLSLDDPQRNQLKQYLASFQTQKPSSLDKNKHPLISPPASPSPVIRNNHQVKTTCGRVNSSAINHQLKIYHWQDLNGQSHMSDKPPASNYSKLKIKNLYVKNFFNLSIDSTQAKLPAFTNDHIQAGVSKIYATLTNVLKIAELRKIQLKLKFISDKNTFQRYRQEVAPNLSAKTTGFYGSKNNESVIWATGNKQHISRVSLHESTHAIVAAMFGGAPVWLNEGLAEFFEIMLITANTTHTFASNNAHLKLLRTSHLPSLTQHFSQSRKQWYHESNSPLNYAIDWSIVFYLMSSSDGRDFLRYMLDKLAVDYCQGFNTISFFNQHYKGGLITFEQQWRNWLTHTKPGVLIL